MLRRIVWSSTLAPSFSAARLNEIIAPARRNNARLQISGMLVFTGIHFLGMHEGEKRDLDSLWRSLEADVRHFDLTRIGDESCGKRWFPTWLVGYSADVDVDRQIESFGALQTLMARRPKPVHLPAPSAWTQIVRPIMLQADSM